MEVSRAELRGAVEREHGCKAYFAYAELVKVTVHDQIAWRGVVHIFALRNCAKALLAYAWSVIDEQTQQRRFHVILRAGHVKSPSDAVRAAGLAEHRTA